MLAPEQPPHAHLGRISAQIRWPSIYSLLTNSYLIPLTLGHGAKALVAPEQHFLREISMLPSATQQEKERENKWCY